MDGQELCFSRSDPAYARWLADHYEDGFVLHGWQDLHRASCPEIAADPEASADPEDKCCVSTGPAQLEYAALMLGGVQHCAKCEPTTDPRGVAMQAEYATRMRAELQARRNES